jgi:class 3 adenylate cyclase
MEPSAELKSIMSRVFASFEAGDSEAIAHRFSEVEGLIVIGTDPVEWWAGHREIVEVLRAQFLELGGWRWVGGEVEAWQEGSVGWVAGRPIVHIGDRAIHPRLTIVFHLEHGEWKIVQFHFSVGVPNEEAIGVALTTSMEVIAEAAAVDKPDLSAASSPDGTVTIVFTDIEDSTVLTERMGDLEWMKLLGEHNRRIQEQVDAHGGFVVKTQGDGYMLAFSSARRAMHCAASIQRAMEGLGADGEGPVRVRIGVHTGEAVRNEDDFFGKSVILASRIAGMAKGGQILVSGLVRDLTESTGEFGFGEGGEVELKGLSGTHRVFELTE